MDEINIQSLRRTYETYFAIRGNQSNEETRVEILLSNTDILSGKINKVYISKSEYHGNGVFASRDIKRGEIITLYPSTYIFIGDKMITNLTNIEKKERQITFDIKQRYTYAFDNNFMICGHPLALEDPSFVGHMVNDGVSLRSEKHSSLYNSVAPRKNNSIYYDIMNVCCAIVATRDIQKDEEVLVTYGCKYWNSLFNHNDKEDLMR